MKIIITGAFPENEFLQDALELSDAKKHPAASKLNLAFNLAQLGNEVHLVTMNGESYKDRIYEKNNVTAHFLNSTGLVKKSLTLFESNKWKMHNYFKQIEPDVINGQNTGRYAYYAVSSKYPSVITPRDLVHNWYLVRKVKKNPVVKRWELYLENKTIDLTANVISISPVIKDYFLKVKNGIKIYEIENAVGREFFDDIKTKKKENKFVYVGSLSGRKRASDIIEALKRIPNAELDLIYFNIGSHDEIQLKKYTAELGIYDRVQFIGYIPNKKLREKICEAKALILPSTAECAPMVISEAMAAGIAVISTNVDGVPYMIDDGRTGFMYGVGKIDELTEKMKYIIDNPEIIEQMSQVAQAEALKRWHPDVISKKTLEAYKEISFNYRI